MKNENQKHPAGRAIADAHVHLYDTAEFHYEWLDKTPRIRRTHTIADYAAATSDFNIKHFICIEAAARKDESADEFRWLNSLSAEDSRFKGIVAHVDLSRGEKVRDELDRIAGNPKLKGVRYALGAAYEKNPKICLDPDFIAGVQILPDYDLSFDLAFEPEQFPDVIEFAEKCSDVQLIINHTGKPPIQKGEFEPWEKFMREFSRLPNVVCKISDVLRDSNGSTEIAEIAPYIEKLIEMFGGKRLMFGSDYPVVTMFGSFKSQLDLLEEIFSKYSEDEQNDFFRRNAERIYRLS